MSKNVNINVKARGADKTKRDMDQVASTTEKAGSRVNRAGKEGAKGTEELSKSASKAKSTFGGFLTSIKTWAAGLVGITAIIAGVTKVIAENKQELADHAEVAAEQQRKLLALQFLGSFFEDKPELRKEVVALSEFGRRPFEEVAEAYYNLRSKAGGLTQRQQIGILTEALELGRTAPDEQLDVLVDMFSLYAKKTNQRDANLIQNILQQTITEAGASAGEVSQYFPEFLPIGLAGKLTGPEAAALWAFATTQTASASVATTGLKAVFLGLQGKGTPEGAKILEQMGVDPQSPFFQKLGQLSSQFQAGKFTLGQAEQLAGREGASVLLDLIGQQPALMQTVKSITGVARPDIDITRTMIEGLLGQDELARVEEDLRRARVMLENAKGQDVRALKIKELLTRAEAEMIERGIGPTRRSMRLKLIETELSLGLPLEYGEFFLNTNPTDAQSTGAPVAAPVTNINTITNHNYNPIGSNQDRTRTPALSPTGGPR